MQKTKEEKKQYMQNLREQWKQSKTLAEQDETAKALYREAGGKFSYTGFYFTLIQMRNQNMDGIPYVDAKTFKGWKESGYIVRKGEKSTISGVTWIDAHADDDDTEKALYPKQYNLFHSSQVDPMK